MMEKLKNKKVLLALVFIVVAIIAALAVIFCTKKEGAKEEKKHIEMEYTMLVEINPSVKLTFQESYDECIDKDGNKSVCSTKEQTVTEYDLVNEDAKEIYKDIDFKGEKLYEAITTLCDTAKDHGIKFDSFEITSDWKTIPSEEDILKKVKEHSKYEEELTVTIKQDNTIKDYNPEVKTYDVTFDSDGGTKVTTQVVKENEQATKPETPTKKGYKFVEWQLNKKAYNFEEKVTKDMTLKAKWEKVTSPSTETEKPSGGSEETMTKKITIPGSAIYTYDQPKTIDIDFNKNINFEVTITGPKSLIDLSETELRKHVTVKLDYDKAKIGVTSLPVKVYFAYPSMSGYVNPISIPVSVTKGYVSNLSKINLNEGIQVIKREYGSCGNSYFTATNPDEVYKKMLEQVKIRPMGFTRAVASRDGNKLMYKFNYLEAEGGQGNFSKYYNQEITKYIKQIEDSFQPATKVFNSCPYSKPEILTESLCKEYFLNCDSW